MTEDQEKSAARAFLRHFATGLPDRAAVEDCCYRVVNNPDSYLCDAGGMWSDDHTCRFLDSIHALGEELITWSKCSTDRDRDRVRARRLHLADASRNFATPVEPAERKVETVKNEFDAFRICYRQRRDEVLRRVCWLVEAVHLLRDDFIAWGKDDLNDWERAPAPVPLVRIAVERPDLPYDDRCRGGTRIVIHPDGQREAVTYHADGRITSTALEPLRNRITGQIIKGQTEQP